MRKIEWDGFASEKAEKGELEGAVMELECLMDWLEDNEQDAPTGERWRDDLEFYINDRAERLRQSLAAYDKSNG